MACEVVRGNFSRWPPLKKTAVLYPGIWLTNEENHGTHQLRKRTSYRQQSLCRIGRLCGHNWPPFLSYTSAFQFVEKVAAPYQVT
jgi:hypothetical protein